MVGTSAERKAGVHHVEHLEDLIHGVLGHGHGLREADLVQLDAASAKPHPTTAGRRHEAKRCFAA